MRPTADGERKADATGRLRPKALHSGLSRDSYPLATSDSGHPLSVDEHPTPKSPRHLAFRQGGVRIQPVSRVATPSTERPRQIAEQVATLARRILGAEVQVYWFGSWAEGRAVDRSDIDVGVMADGPIPVDRIGRLRGAVEDLPTLYTVDLVDLATADPALRERALSRGIRL